MPPPVIHATAIINVHGHVVLSKIRTASVLALGNKKRHTPPITSIPLITSDTAWFSSSNLPKTLAITQDASVHDPITTSLMLTPHELFLSNIQPVLSTKLLHNTTTPSTLPNLLPSDRPLPPPVFLLDAGSDLRIADATAAILATSRLSHQSATNCA